MDAGVSDRLGFDLFIAGRGRGGKSGLQLKGVPGNPGDRQENCRAGQCHRDYTTARSFEQAAKVKSVRVWYFLREITLPLDRISAFAMSGW